MKKVELPVLPAAMLTREVEKLPIRYFTYGTYIVPFRYFVHIIQDLHDVYNGYLLKQDMLDYDCRAYGDPRSLRDNPPYLFRVAEEDFIKEPYSTVALYALVAKRSFGKYND